MRRALATLSRLAVWSVLILTLTALGLGRHVPPSSRPPRLPSPAGKVLINRFPGLRRPVGEGLLWLDAETGQTTKVPLRGRPMLRFASLSPWRDAWGRSQIVGFRCQGINKGGITLERVSFPDGAVLDAIQTDVFPSGSRVCWYPGTRARVLFVGGDKQLYQFAFEGDTRGPGQTGAAGGPMDRPQPLAWAGQDPRRGGIWFEDLHWPTDPRFTHLVLASSRAFDRSLLPGRGGLAWLRLGEAGDSVEEWGCLLDPSTLTSGSSARDPTLAIAEDGRLMLAYFEGRRGGQWILRMTPTALGPDGRPRTVTEPGRVVVEGCLDGVPAVFSRDGRSASVVLGGPGGSPVVRRIDLNELWRSCSAARHP